MALKTPQMVIKAVQIGLNTPYRILLTTIGRNWEECVAMIFDSRLNEKRNESNAKSFIQKTFWELGGLYFDGFDLEKLSPSMAFIEVKIAV